MRTLLLLFFLVLGISRTTKALDLENLPQIDSLQNIDSLLETIRFNDYISIQDLQSEENCTAWKATLESKNYPFGQVLLRLSEGLMEGGEIEVTNSQQLQAFFTLGTFAFAQQNREGEIAADMLLSSLALSLELAIKEKQINPNDAIIKNYIDVLKIHNYSVSIPVSDVQKGLHHLQSGNFSYLINRVYLEFTIPIWIGGTLLLLLLVYWLRKRKINKKK